jgi:hypothetical protein
MQSRLMKTCVTKYVAARAVKPHAKCVPFSFRQLRRGVWYRTRSATTDIYLCAENRFNDEDLLLIRSQRASTLLRSLLRRKRIEARLRVTYVLKLYYIIIYTRHVHPTPGQGLISTKTRFEVVFVVFFSLCLRART